VQQQTRWSKHLRPCERTHSLPSLVISTTRTTDKATAFPQAANQVKAVRPASARTPSSRPGGSSASSAAALARRTARQGHPRIADPRGITRMKRFREAHVHAKVSDDTEALPLRAGKRDARSPGGLFIRVVVVADEKRPGDRCEHFAVFADRGAAEFLHDMPAGHRVFNYGAGLVGFHLPGPFPACGMRVAPRPLPSGQCLLLPRAGHGAPRPPGESRPGPLSVPAGRRRRYRGKHPLAAIARPVRTRDGHEPASGSPDSCTAPAGGASPDCESAAGYAARGGPDELSAATR
jgi:hypothetical protein